MVRIVSCDGAVDRREVYPPSPRFELVLARHGAHGIHGPRGTVLATPGTCFFGEPRDHEVELSHPLGRHQAHASTVVSFGRDLWEAAGGDRIPLPANVQADASVELAHRRLVGLVGRQSPEEPAAELVTAMIAGLLTSLGSLPHRAELTRDQAGLDLAQEALAMLHLDVNLPGERLAAALYCSRYQLSRLLVRHTGRGLAAHRTRIRTRQVLDHLADGQGSLADLAAATGFADHAHLTRTVQACFGATPSALRAMLAGPPPDHLRPGEQYEAAAWWSHCRCAACDCLES